MIGKRIGSISGLDSHGQYRVVSVYQDHSAIKLCGPSGSWMARGDINQLMTSVANECGLSDLSFTPSVKAARAS